MNLLIGRFHPLLVHLPIGILLIALLFELLSRKARFRFLQPAVRVLLFSGAIAAVGSCITGYLLSLQDDYQEDILLWHLVMGITTAVISIGLFFICQSAVPLTRRIYHAGCVVLFCIISVTGHLGGSLTHGTSYVTEVLPSPFKKWFSGSGDEARVIANVQDALVYADIIKPILEEKCKACHGETKQKGELRLDLPERILKGGKKGKTIVMEKPFESEMIKRIYLPLNHEHHMPPKGKSQITPAEVQLLQWWISQGAKFDKKVTDLPQTEMIKPILASLQSSDPDKTIFANVDLPEAAVSKVPDSVLLSLRNRNIAVVPVTRKSNYVSVSFIAFPDATDEMVSLLQPLTKNILSLKLGDTKITNKALKTVGKFENLVRLSLEHTSITDNGLPELNNLVELQYINLVGTAVTTKGILELQSLKKLKKLYLYQTAVGASDFTLLKEKFPGVILDKGAYAVPTFTEDTTKVTVKK